MSVTAFLFAFCLGYSEDYPGELQKHTDKSRACAACVTRPFMKEKESEKETKREKEKKMKPGRWIKEARGRKCVYTGMRLRKKMLPFLIADDVIRFPVSVQKRKDKKKRIQQKERLNLVPRGCDEQHNE